MKRAIFLTSFFSMNCSGSKFLTSAAIRQANAEASNPVMQPTPLWPSSKASHTVGVVLPTAQIRPIPLMTTRRDKLLARLRVLADVVHGVLHGADLFRVLVGDFDVEGLFEGHHQFHCVEGVSSQVVYERGAGSDLALVHAQLLNNDLLHFFVNGCHVSPRFKIRESRPDFLAGVYSKLPLQNCSTLE